MTKSNKYLKFLFVFLFLFMVFGLAACDNADKKAAQAVDSAIEALPAEVTLADEEAILSAREEYDKLTDKQKELVTKLEILESKESELQDLKDIKAVEDLIAAIPETVTLADQAKIQAARTAYNALSSALQSRVSNLEDLEDAEEAYQELVASQQAVDAVIDLIDDLPDAEDATLDDEEDVNDAKAAFDALKENEKEQVTNVDKLNALIAKIAQLKADQEDRDAAEAVDLMIAFLPVLVQLADKELVEEARAAYDALTETQKALITGLDKLEAAETRIVDLEAAKVVIDMIAALPETLALDDEDDVIAAREAYDALSEVRKSMVTNLDLLRAKEEELEILKNPDLAVLNPLIKQIPDQIIDDFTFPTAEGVTWAYKDGEDDSLFDLEAGILLKTSFETALRTIEVSYGETTLELVINFGVVKEDFTPIFYVGGAAADKPAEGNNWDGYGTWDKQLAKTGFGGYLIEYGNKVYFISKNAFIPLVGTEENEHLDRETLRPLGMNGQDSRNNLGLINGIPTEYAGTAALYYNAGDVPIKFYGCDTYGRVNAVFAGYGKVVFSRQEDGSYKVGPMIPEHGGGDDVGTKEGSYIITLNPGDYLWTPHTWETDYNNSGFGTRLCSAQGVLTENSPITVKKFKFVQEFEVEYNLNGGAFVYPTKQEMIEAFLRDFYDFVSPEESLSDFMHGVGKTSGYDGTWHSSHKAKIYAGARPTEVNEDYFISSAKYMEKWLPFFDMMDEFVKINSAQSFWGGTWTGNIRIRQYIINELPGSAWTEEDMNMMPDPLIQSAPISVFTAFTEDFDLPVPHRDGFVFGGWFDNPAFDGEKISKVAEGTKENLTLYARWLTTAIDAEVDYNVALNASHGTYYIKVTVPGESLDKDSVDSIYVIMEAGTFVEPRALTPDTDTMMWFGVAKFDGLMYKEAGKYGYEVTRKDGTSYQFFFDYDPGEVVGLPERIEAEVDYNAVYNESHERWYIKVTPGEPLDENSIKSIKTIKEAGEYLAEPKVLVPDTDTVMWFGVALADKDFSYRENGEYAFEVVRADDSVYFFFFTYDFREVDIYDISFAEAVDALILALPEELTLEDKEAVEEARAAYEELTERQKEYVENLGYLVAKETELAEMLDELENLQEYLATLPEQILVNYKLNTTDYDWAYKEGEDETVFDILTGELKEVRMTQTVRTFVVSSKLLPKVKVEHSINFGLTPEGAVAVIHGNNEAPADPEEYSISTYYALPFNNYTMSFEKDGTKYIYFVCQQLLFDETTTNFKPPKGASSIGLLYVNKSGADKTILLSDTYAINNAAYQDLVIDADGNVIEAIGAYTAEQTVTIPKDGYFWTPAYGDKPGIVGYSPNYDLRTGFAVGDVITFESGLLARMYPDLDGAVLEAGDVLPPLQWNSSNPDVIASDGTITPDLFEDKEVTLTAVVGTTGESEEVKVIVKAAGVDLIDAEVDYQAVYNADHGRWYIKVTVSGELLDAESISDIKAIMRAGEMLAEPVTLGPDTDTVLWFGVADETGDLGYKEAGEYAFLVTRKDGSQYVFKFDYDPEEVAGVIPNIQAVRDASVGTDVYTQGVVTSVIGNNAFIQDGSAGIYLYLGSNSSYADILVVGNLVRVNGKRAVFNSLVQISNISSIELVATEQELPEAVEFDGYVEISDLKDLQGSLVTLTGFKIKSIPTIG
ncbi:MAG: InlB B-repeat-containing protein, partial [Bacilli bacterium]